MSRKRISAAKRERFRVGREIRKNKAAARKAGITRTHGTAESVAAGCQCPPCRGYVARQGTHLEIPSPPWVQDLLAGTESAWRRAKNRTG